MVLLKICIIIILAFLTGQLTVKLGLPPVLGWLIAGMILGPHALNLISTDLLKNHSYNNLNHFAEVSAGVIIGMELVWKEIKKSGKQIITITFFEALLTFLLVSLGFKLIGMPTYIAIIFGGIALPTAPAPSLSIIQQYKAKGPVSKTLIPLAALDDIGGLVVFFTVISIIGGKLSGSTIPSYLIPLMVLLPIIFGSLMGGLTAIFLRYTKDIKKVLVIVVGTLILTTALGQYINHSVLPKPVLNLLMVGVGYSAVIANAICDDVREALLDKLKPITGIALLFLIVNMGAPLDYHLIIQAGMPTLIYIVFRMIGKYYGAYYGAKISHAPDTVKKYLGFTLIPHAGVSLLFTGIAVNMLLGVGTTECNQYAEMIQGTIAAAAIINEIIAVFLAQFGFRKAGEIG